MKENTPLARFTVSRPGDGLQAWPLRPRYSRLWMVRWFAGTGISVAAAALARAPSACRTESRTASAGSASYCCYETLVLCYCCYGILVLLCYCVITVQQCYAGNVTLLYERVARVRGVALH